MGVHVRAATIADAEGLGRMHHASWIEAYSPLFPPDFWDSYPVQPRINTWRRSLITPTDGTTLMLADSDGDIVGHALVGPGRDGPTGAYPSARDDELWSLYVLASHQGTGLAQRLLNAVLDPATPAQLWVFERNPRARAFYARNGFTPDGTRHIAGPELGNQPEIRLIR